MAQRRDVLILTGNAGVGKSTVARAWAARHGGVAVRADDIRSWIRVRALQHAESYQEQLLARIALAAASEFLVKGLDVALDSVWSPDGIATLRRSLDPIARVCVVRLWCTPDENHRRDEQRSGGDVMGKRIDELELELAAMRFPADVAVIDSTHQTPEQTLEAIERLFTTAVAR